MTVGQPCIEIDNHETNVEARQRRPGSPKAYLCAPFVQPLTVGRTLGMCTHRLFARAGVTS